MRVLAIEDRVRLDDLERADDPRLGDQLAGEVRLAVGEPAGHGRADTGRDLGVERVEVERDVDEARARDAVERLPHRVLDPDPVDVAHREDADVGLAQERALGRVERADPDEGDARRVDGGQREPVVGEPLGRPPERGGERHPVHVAGRARLGRVEVAVRVDPDHAARLPRGGGEAGERPDRDRVVAAEHERARAVAHRLLDERRKRGAGVEDLGQVARPLVVRARAPRARARRRCRGRRRSARSRVSRSSSPAYRIADGPMSTPRRVWPRSRGAPMIETGRRHVRNLPRRA